MFERRQRAIESLNFTQAQRRLKSNEALPAIPGLAAQLMACQTEIARRQRADRIEPGDEMDLAPAAEDDPEDF